MITAHVGENVVLHCFKVKEENSGVFVWYKQKAGHGLRVIVAVHHEPSYEDEFKPPKFSIKRENVESHLKIANVEPSDEAMYYCGLRNFLTRFGNGTYLLVKGKNLREL